jgi:hypothetical protein
MEEKSTQMKNENSKNELVENIKNSREVQQWVHIGLKIIPISSTPHDIFTPQQYADIHL